MLVWNSKEYEIIQQGAYITSKDIAPIAATLQSYGFPNKFVPPIINTDDIKWTEEKKAKEAGAIIGLDYFRVNDASVFKGRDREINELQR